MDEWALGDDAKPSDQVFKSDSQFGKFFKVHNAKYPKKESIVNDLKKAAK